MDCAPSWVPSSHPWFLSLAQCPVIAIIRSPRFDWGYRMALTALEGGVQSIEIAWGDDRTTLDLIEQLRQNFPQQFIGVGTICTSTQLQQAIHAGCQFAFSPVSLPPLWQQSQACGIPFVPGALTPTEIWNAWQGGAAAVKVFPIKSVGGTTYLRCLREALGTGIPLIPTGGVTPDHAAEFLQAGAIAVGLSGALFPRRASGEPDYGETEKILKKLLPLSR